MIRNFLISFCILLFIIVCFNQPLLANDNIDENQEEKEQLTGILYRRYIYGPNSQNPRIDDFWVFRAGQKNYKIKEISNDINETKFFLLENIPLELMVNIIEYDNDRYEKAIIVKEFNLYNDDEDFKETIKQSRGINEI